jgi:hypothetical protein
MRFSTTNCDKEENRTTDQKLQIHGWPDLSIGWRYQIPFLLDMGFRVVAPDLMGFGGTVR